MNGIFKKISLFFVQKAFSLYKLVFSPLFSLAFNVHCRYEESCSQFMLRKILEKGILKGTFLGLKRILSCNRLLEIKWIKNYF